jgi:uncharacterized membrane-anchored protein YhcB (DUF1043 family)
MNNAFLFGLAMVTMLGAGVMVGLVIGRSRQRLLQRELDQLQSALQRSRSELQQREEALQHSRQELQRNQQEVQRSQEELHQQQEALQRSQQDFLHSQEESRQYCTHVTQHFTQTADLLQTLTLNYRAVYEHLAAGAEALCEGQVKTLTPETLRERLLAPPREETAAEGAATAQPLTAAPDAEHQPASFSQDPHNPESV